MPKRTPKQTRGKPKDGKTNFEKIRKAIGSVLAGKKTKNPWVPIKSGLTKESVVIQNELKELHAKYLNIFTTESQPASENANNNDYCNGWLRFIVQGSGAHEIAEAAMALGISCKAWSTDNKNFNLQAVFYSQREKGVFQGQIEIQEANEHGSEIREEYNLYDGKIYSSCVVWSDKRSNPACAIVDTRQLLEKLSQIKKKK